ncbi:MAG: hypothetical protein AB1758_10715, partial [Candidatus Eremiobacterota bacterium]
RESSYFEGIGPIDPAPSFEEALRGGLGPLSPAEEVFLFARMVSQVEPHPEASFELHYLLTALEESGSPQALLDASLYLAARGVQEENPGYLAAAARLSAGDPDRLAVLLRSVGPDQVDALTAALFGREEAHALAAQVVLTASELPPEDVLAFFLSCAGRLDGFLLANYPELRQGVARGLAVTLNPGDPDRALEEARRLEEVLGDPRVTDTLDALEPSERSQFLAWILDSRAVTLDMIERHHGNFATIGAELLLSETGQSLLGATVSQVSPGAELGLDSTEFPALDKIFANLSPRPALGDFRPLTVDDVRQAIERGLITNREVADILDALAEQVLVHSDLETFGGVPGLDANSWQGIVVRVANGGNLLDIASGDMSAGNPISEANLDEAARMEAELLRRLAEQVRSQDDSLFSSQALAAAGAHLHLFESVLPVYAEDVADQGESARRNARLLGRTAQIVVPFLVGLLGGPLASALAAGVLTGSLAAAEQGLNPFDLGSVGQVNWGRVTLSGGVDALTTLAGYRYASYAQRSGFGFARTVGVGATMDGLGNVGSYLMRHPELVPRLMNGERTAWEEVGIQFGIGFGGSFLSNGVSYRTPVRRIEVAAGRDWSGHHEDMLGILTGPGPLHVWTLDGRVATRGELADTAFESYYAVYRRGDEVRVVEVARATTRDPLNLETVAVVNGIRAGAPDDDWTLVGGFHNHPTGTSVPSGNDLAAEVVLRGEFGEGFVNFTVASDSGRLVATAFGSDVPGIPLALAQRLGFGDSLGALGVYRGEADRFDLGNGWSVVGYRQMELEALGGPQVDAFGFPRTAYAILTNGDSVVIVTHGAEWGSMPWLGQALDWIRSNAARMGWNLETIEYRIAVCHPQQNRTYYVEELGGDPDEIIGDWTGRTASPVWIRAPNMDDPADPGHLEFYAID